MRGEGIKGGPREIREGQKSVVAPGKVQELRRENGAWRVVSSTGVRGLQGEPKAGCEGCGLAFNDGSSVALAQGSG